MATQFLACPLFSAIFFLNARFSTPDIPKAGWRISPRYSSRNIMKTQLYSVGNILIPFNIVHIIITTNFYSIIFHHFSWPISRIQRHRNDGFSNALVGQPFTIGPSPETLAPQGSVWRRLGKQGALVCGKGSNSWDRENRSG